MKTPPFLKTRAPSESRSTQFPKNRSSLKERIHLRNLSLRAPKSHSINQNQDGNGTSRCNFSPELDKKKALPWLKGFSPTD